MRRTVALVAAATALVAIPAAPAQAGNDKTAICHATGSESNPYNYIELSVRAVKEAHVDHQHGEDIIPPLEAIGLPEGQNWTEKNRDLLVSKCVTQLPDTGAQEYALLLVGGTALLGAGWFLTKGAGRRRAV